MTQDSFKPLLMGYLDAELGEEDARRVEEHLRECPDCSSEFSEFRRLKEVTQTMRLVAPDERYWQAYWSSVYNRLERKVGWILTSVGAIVLAAYGLYYLLFKVLFHNGVSVVVRIGTLALIIGFCTLLISVLRERIFLAKSDKYERVKR